MAIFCDMDICKSEYWIGKTKESTGMWDTFKKKRFHCCIKNINKSHAVGLCSYVKKENKQCAFKVVIFRFMDYSGIG